MVLKSGVLVKISRNREEVAVFSIAFTFAIVQKVAFFKVAVLKFSGLLAVKFFTCILVNEYVWKLLKEETSDKLSNIIFLKNRLEIIINSENTRNKK